MLKLFLDDILRKNRIKTATSFPAISRFGKINLTIPEVSYGVFPFRTDVSVWTMGFDAERWQRGAAEEIYIDNVGCE